MTASKIRNLKPADEQRSVSSKSLSRTDTVSSDKSTSQSVPALAQILQSSTSLALVLVGGVLAVAVLLSDAEATTETAGFGVASTAIAGAAGLAQASNGRND